MIIELRGGESRAAAGVLEEARAGAYKELIVNDVGFGRYFEANRNGHVFTAANTAVQALSVGSATATGLILSNPLGSGTALILLQASFAPSIDQTADTVVGLFQNDNVAAAAVTHTTPITPKPGLIGAGTTPVGKTDSAATLPAVPTLIRPLLGGGWATAAGFAQGAAAMDLVDGQLVLLPNTALSIQALTTAVTGVSGMTWAEVAWPL
jgi:hypothetical protein